MGWYNIIEILYATCRWPISSFPFPWWPCNHYWARVANSNDWMELYCLLLLFSICAIGKALLSNIGIEMFSMKFVNMIHHTSNQF